MKSINYSEFLNTVLVAEGTFSYRFEGIKNPMLCNPGIWIARNCSGGREQVVRDAQKWAAKGGR